MSCLSALPSWVRSVPFKERGKTGHPPSFFKKWPRPMEEVEVHYIFSRYVLSNGIFANRKLKCSIDLPLTTFWSYISIRNRRLKAVFVKSITFWPFRSAVLIRNRKKHIISAHEPPWNDRQSAELAFFSRRFCPFRQKRIILTFSIGCFDKQSEKAYYFRTRNSVLAMPFLGTDRAFVNHMPVYVFWQR